MKKLALMMIMLSSVVYSQEIATTENGKKVVLNKNGTYKYLKEETESKELTSKDFKTVDENVISTKKTINVINGDEKDCSIDFSFSANTNIYSNISVDVINNMISTANIKTMFLMKNRRTYIPKKIFIYYSTKENNWVVNTEYTAQNNYGATKDGKTFALFDSDGKFISIL